ncbi:ATP-binding protein [Niabella terrae]
MPESVYQDRENNVLYVSNIDGADGWTVDSVGSVVQLDFDGKLVKDNWVTGLNAPKGIGKFQNKLFVADVEELVIIDIASGQVLDKVKPEGAQRLNDVTVDDKGAVYVTDTKSRVLYRYVNNSFQVMLDSNKLKGPNGVLFSKGDLYIADAGSLYRIEQDNQLTELASGMEASTDGIVELENGDFIVSCWVGTVYYIGKDGSKKLLLDTRDQQMNTADIDYDPESRTLYIPTFFKNKLQAYKVE